jgi:hypothetical protein
VTTTRAFLLAASLAFACRTLMAQEAPPRSGLVPVLTAGDGTQVFVDAASVVHTGDSSFVASTVLRFAPEAARQRQVDTEVDTDEIDCAGGRVRAMTGALYRESALVQHNDSATGRFEPVPAGWLPIVQATCAVLHGVFGSMPVEREVAAAEIAPALANRGEIRRELTREAARMGRNPRMPAAATAMVRVRIMETGAVDSASVRVPWAERSEIAAAAARVVMRMRFRPALAGSNPVPVRASLPVTFLRQ